MTSRHILGVLCVFLMMTSATSALADDGKGDKGGGSSSGGGDSGKGDKGGGTSGGSDRGGGNLGKGDHAGGGGSGHGAGNLSKSDRGGSEGGTSPGKGEGRSGNLGKSDGLAGGAGRGSDLGKNTPSKSSVGGAVAGLRGLLSKNSPAAGKTDARNRPSTTSVGIGTTKQPVGLKITDFAPNPKSEARPASAPKSSQRPGQHPAGAGNLGGLLGTSPPRATDKSMNPNGRAASEQGNSQPGNSGQRGRSGQGGGR